MQKVIHLKGLNGLRAIAAVSVVVSHIILQLINSKSPAGAALGSYAVTLFFTLSGFLITYLLIKEKAAFGNISVKAFYTRRLLRVWPLYYFYLAIVLIILFASEGKLPASSWYYVFIAANLASIQGIAPALLEHYWSLGVEEQFYLFWPWLFKYSSPLKSITVFLLLFVLIKAALRFWLPDSLAYWFMFSSRFDCMAIGALLAILTGSNNRPFFTICFHPALQIACWLILLLGGIGKFQLLGFADHDIFAAASGIIILNVAFNSKTLVGLEHRVLDWLGKISYGIYVYHVLVLFLVKKLLMKSIVPSNHWLLITLAAAVTVGSTILIAWQSFELIEKRFLLLKARFSKILSRI